jgi:hypothetical protein
MTSDPGDERGRGEGGGGEGGTGGDGGEEEGLAWDVGRQIGIIAVAQGKACISRAY